MRRGTSLRLMKFHAPKPWLRAASKTMVLENAPYRQLSPAIMTVDDAIVWLAELVGPEENYHASG